MQYLEVPDEMNGNVRYWSTLQLHGIAQRTSAWECARRHNVISNPTFNPDSAKARSWLIGLGVCSIATNAVLIGRNNMKKSAIFAAAILGLAFANAQAEDYLHGQSESTYQNMGNSTYGSDGSTSQRIGNTTYSSDGSTSQRIGNTTYGSDGTTCQKIGSSTYCN